jgi:putative phage-type endonuclease
MTTTVTAELVLDGCITEPREVDRDKWLMQRVNGIGGSDAAKLVGASDWGGPVDIYLEKTGRRKPDFTQETKKMQWGNRLEKPILDAYQEEFCTPLGKSIAAPTVMYRSSEYPWMFANPDSLVIVPDGPMLDRGVDAKNSSAYDKWGPSGSQQYPLDYYFQCLHYMIVLGVKYWDLAVLLGGWDFRTYTVERVDEDAEKLVAVEENFWKNHVIADVSPPLEAESPRALDLIKELYTGFDPRPVILPDMMIADIEERERLTAGIKELEEKKGMTRSPRTRAASWTSESRSQRKRNSLQPWPTRSKRYIPKSARLSPIWNR